MRTWLPVANVTASMQALHDDDLDSQIIEAGLCLRELFGDAQRTPTGAMWHGYEGGLWSYFLHACQEQQRRGVDTSALVTRGFRLLPRGEVLRPYMPRWYGYRPIHLSHASTLIRQRPDHYARLWPEVPLDMPLLWPRNTEGHFDFSIRISSRDRQALLDGSLVLSLNADGPLGKVKV